MQHSLKKNLFAVSLDIIFYLMFIPIIMLTSKLLLIQVNKIYSISSQLTTNTQDIAKLSDMQGMLAGILAGLLGIICLFILLIIINFAVFKSMIWCIALGKKISLKLILKSILLTLLLCLIFIIPLFLASVPLLIKAAEYVNDAMQMKIAEPQQPSFIVIVPLMVAILIFIYFFTLSFYYLAKESSIKKSIKLTFTEGFFKMEKTIPIYLLFAGTMIISIILLRYFGLLATMPGMIIFVICMIAISFFERNRYAKSLI